MKIYSLRVDSVHSEAYKVLGGINRAGRGEEAGKDSLNLAMDSSLLLILEHLTFLTKFI